VAGILLVSYAVFFAFSGSAAQVLLLVPVALAFIVDVAVQGRTGRTPGKRLMGLCCVEEDSGEPPGRTRAFIRWVLWLVDGLGGAVVAFFSRGHRRLGDMAAHTVIVDAAALEAWKAERSMPPSSSNGRRRNPYADDQWLGGPPPSAADWGKGP